MAYAVQYFSILIQYPVTPNIRSSILALLLLAGTCCGSALYGQSPITSFSASYVTTLSTLDSYTALPASQGTFSGCSSTTYQYTFSNGISNQYKLNSFNANGLSYLVAPAAAATVKLRRVDNTNATGNRTIVYMETALSSATACITPAILSFKPPYLDAMETVLNAGMLNQGTDNIFTNAGNGDGNNNNVERVDILFPSGLNTANPSQAGFAIFDRGNNYQHDPFRIVAITSVDANGDPASFGAVKVCSGGNGSSNNGSWGHPSTGNGNMQFAAYVMRKDAAETRLRVSSNVNQQVGGVFYTFADLGITAGQPLYGYALLAADGTANPSSAQLLNLSNTTVYPTGTTESQGGLDLVAVNTVFATGSYIVLPLQIGAFSGSMQQDGSRLLEWTLANADGQHAVSLERSGDGLLFTAIYSSNISDNPAAPPANYAYTDRDLIGADVYYYRLKITDASGVAQYSRTLTLHGAGDNTPAGAGITAKWKVYPTIAGSSQQLKVEGIPDGYYTAVFYAMGGASRKSSFHALNKTAWIDQPPGGLPAGIYWLRFVGANDEPTSGNGIKLLIR